MPSSSRLGTRDRQPASQTSDSDGLLAAGVEICGHWCGSPCRGHTAGVPCGRKAMKDSTVSQRSMQVTDLDPSFSTRQHRLEALRREAAQVGRVDGVGVRPGGSPIPVASVAAGYYGIPMPKEPQWSCEVPIYLFVGGAAEAAALIAQ